MKHFILMVLFCTTLFAQTTNYNFNASQALYYNPATTEYDFKDAPIPGVFTIEHDHMNRTVKVGAIGDTRTFEVFDVYFKGQDKFKHRGKTHYVNEYVGRDVKERKVHIYIIGGQITFAWPKRDMIIVFYEPIPVTGKL